MNYLIAYDEETGQIEHYVSTSGGEPKEENLPTLKSGQKAIRVKDPAFEITRDHKMIFDGDTVIGTEPSANPVQPLAPASPSLKAEIESLKDRVAKLEAKAAKP